MNSTWTIDSRIHRFAAPQLGMASAAQLGANHVDKHAIHRRLAAGRCVRLAPAVYWFTPRDGPLTRDEIAMAGLLRGGPGCVLALDSAAAYQCVWNRPGATMHLKVTHRVRHVVAPALEFHRLHDPRNPWRRADGPPIYTTAPVTTVWQFAARHQPHQVATVIRHGIHERLYDIDTLQHELADAPARPGIAVARAGLGLYLDGSAGTKNRSEDHMLDAILDADVPAPFVNVRGITGIEDYEPDFAWIGHRIVLEVDGGQHLNDPVQARRDRERDELLTRMGWIVIRIPWRRVWTHTDATINQLRTAFAQRS